MTTAPLDHTLVTPVVRAAMPAPMHRWWTQVRSRQVRSFVAVGTVSTGLYLALYLLLRVGMSAFAANLVAQVVSTLFSTAANRRFTFGVTDPSTVARHHLQMLALLALNLLLNNLALEVLAVSAPDAGAVVELLVLSGSGLVVTLARVLVMRRWSRGHRTGQEFTEPSPVS